jgi:hypothetical protein
MAGACNLTSQCIKRPPEGHTLSPFVRIKFKVSGVEISVGNESAPSIENRACIKDFEFGHGNGFECRVTIHDDFGGSFTKFMEDILKDAKCATPQGGVTMEVDFGWINSLCDGGGGVVEKSPKYHMMCMDIMCNFAGGKFMFEVTGKDITATASDAKFTKIYGGEGDQAEYLTEAIKKMFTEGPTPPVVQQVRFLRVGSGTCGGSPEPAGFEKFDNGDKMKGPKGKWEANNVDKITAAMNWLSKYNTDRKKGWVPAYNSEVEGGEMIFWEDTKPNCGETLDWEGRMLGAYVVNGGQSSKVIEFNPKIKWNFSSLTNAGGSMGEAQTSGNPDTGGKNEGIYDCESLKRKKIGDTGSQTTSAADENMVNREGGQANKETDKAQSKQQKAFKLDHYPIEADLVVVGEPTLLRPSLCLYRNLWIIFFNPFFINGGGQGRCGDWLSVPPPGCNPILSNKAWLIRQVVHRISDGKFTTNFQVFLTGPGVDTNVGEPVGGLGSGGWVPPSNC